ncbi:MAG: IS21-like element helper ATPase IstB [Gammaproteobacteria bacterium]
MNTHEALELRLKAFRLPSFLAHYAPLGQQAAQRGWTHPQYLDELALIEATDRADRRIARLAREARLPRDKTLATLELNRFPPAVRTQVQRLAPGEFLTGATNVCLFGHPGTGKTHVMAMNWCGPGTRCYSRRWRRWWSRLLEAKRDLRLTRELKRLDAFDCLALDDIGYVQHDRAEMEVLFTLLAERYERKSVMITSNLVFSQWDQIFKDPMTTAPAIDRVVHHAVIVELAVPSYRAEVAERRRKTKRSTSAEA